MMGDETPPFWWQQRPGWQARLLAPAAGLYGAVARRNLDKGERAEAGVPVLCVGNFIVGGGGKTPTAIALGRDAKTLGRKPGFLTRGYGGRSKGPLLVDPDRHDAGAVGDEAVLLAEVAPTAVAVDRKRGAELLVGSGVDFIIMDDGFQSARMAIDYALMVIDAGRGLGNGAVMPAGPLRAPLRDQIRHADALLVIGRGEAGDEAIRRTARGGKPVFSAMLKPRRDSGFGVDPYLAFAGIADPEKFYRSLREAGAMVLQTRDFPDHHPFSRQELADLAADAEREGLRLITTRKDAVRVFADGHAEAGYADRLEVFDIDLVFEPASLAGRIVRDTVKTFRRRIFG